MPVAMGATPEVRARDGQYTARMDHFTLHQGHAPLLISLPHDSSVIPEALAARMLPAARRSIDTDWHVARLYAPLAAALGASVITPLVSRYVVDLNRPRDGQPLYPGQRETSVVPTIGFDGVPLYADGHLPTPAEVQQRIATFWQPYHDALARELARLVAIHGHAVLWDGHSIRSQVPMLFAGRLPDFNLGTGGGSSCRTELQSRLQARLERADVRTHAVNGRFKGGYITRHYGDPAHGVDAIQLELAQCNYMDEDSLAWDEAKAASVRTPIADLLALTQR